MPEEIEVRAEATQYLEGRGNGVDDPGATIAQRILEGETEDDIFGGPQKLQSLSDRMNEPFELIDVEFSRSTIKGDGVGAFALLQVKFFRPGSVTEVVSCGGRNVMAAAFAGKKKDLLPITLKLVQAEKATEAGYRPLWLVKATKTEVAAAKKLRPYVTPADDDNEDSF